MGTELGAVYQSWCIYVQHQTPFHMVVHQVVYHFVMFIGACACTTCPLFWRIGHSRLAVLCLWKMEITQFTLARYRRRGDFQPNWFYDFLYLGYLLRWPEKWSDKWLGIQHETDRYSESIFKLLQENEFNFENLVWKDISERAIW